MEDAGPFWHKHVIQPIQGNFLKQLLAKLGIIEEEVEGPSAQRLYLAFQQHVPVVSAVAPEQRGPGAGQGGQMV